jgi:GNAT superfamily N-acetyltransferase
MIRRAETDADLAGWCEVWAAITPREPVTVEQIRARLERQPWRLYLVAEEEDGFVGLGFVGPTDSPGRIAVAVRVLPGWRGRRLGSQLFEQALAHALEQEPEWLSGHVSGADPDALGWAERRGFEEYGRDVELVRRLRRDEPPPPALDGIEIVEVGPELHDAAYALTREAWEDLPTGFAVDTPDFDTWLEEDLAGPVAFAALDDGEVVGFAALMERDAPGLLEHGLTATRRTHRRRGIATALKQRQIAWAAAGSYRELVTFTQDGNEGMQAINLALGYELQPPWIRVRRRT